MNPEKVVLQGLPCWEATFIWQIIGGEAEVSSEECDSNSVLEILVEPRGKKLLGPTEATLGEDDGLTLTGFSCFFNASETGLDGLLLRVLVIFAEEDLG
ncbi:hypothetical protein CDAR_567311 [Caerostris darwini]|uniref:Uncharacterized protein n=1 Tax=Caerostris darwini TaxID=1538125 RepID=A0AAV4QU67_9ARAC|nr:hypothetical protein CDAR_567311 [Caerostris darwini]